MKLVSRAHHKQIARIDRINCDRVSCRHEHAPSSRSSCTPSCAPLQRASGRHHHRRHHHRRRRRRRRNEASAAWRGAALRRARRRLRRVTVARGATQLFVVNLVRYLWRSEHSRWQRPPVLCCIATLVPYPPMFSMSSTENLNLVSVTSTTPPPLLTPLLDYLSTKSRRGLQCPPLYAYYLRTGPELGTMPIQCSQFARHYPL